MILLACLLLATASVRAESLSVTVDAALTNGTGWVYTDGFVYSTENKAYYFKKANAAVISPPLGFVVTDVVATAKRNSEGTTRTLKMAACGEDGEPLASSIVEHTSGTDKTSCAATWSATNGYERIKLYNDSGNGSLYLYDITVRGVPFVNPPEGLHVRQVRGESVSLAWTNDPRAASSRTVVEQIVSTPESWRSVVRHYDFEDCKKEGTVTKPSAYLAEHYPEFGGTNFGIMVTGQIQLGTADELGWLSYSGLTNFAGIAMGLRLKRVNQNDDDMTSVTAYKDGEDRMLSAVALGDQFENRIVSLDEAPEGALICLNTQCRTKKGDQRVAIDDIWFYDGYVPASTVTNVVAVVEGTGSEATVTGLKPHTTYRAYVTATDAQGHVSAPSDFCTFTTTAVGALLWIR